jgi:beta-galactosidase
MMPLGEQGAGTAPERKTDIAPPSIAFGAAWYPEQWPEPQWTHDLERMRDARMNVLRIGEFAWSSLEPRDQEFDFGWLDRAIDAAATRGFRLVLGTPTAAPPAWLTAAYPDVLRVSEDGRRAEHGGRRHFSFASSRYRQFARRIASEMARRYGSNPHVIGWQIDNEIGPPSFDDEARALWADWLEARYGSIDELNARWSTAYWSQTYQHFGQVPLKATGQQNPALLLDFRRFVTDVWTDYIENQASAIREFRSPEQWITTNTMHWNGGFDHPKLHRILDMAAWDDYVPDGRPDWLFNGAQHDLVRGYKQRNFWVMETQAGHVDWAQINRALDPGQMREMGWQAIGHGADGLLYWQWRSALNGQEQYYGVLVGPGGEPTYVFDEIANTGAAFERAAQVIAGTRPRAEVAMLFSQDSRWAIEIQPQHRGFEPIEAFMAYYRPLRAQAQAVDIIPVDAALDVYKLVVAPCLNVLSATDAARLEAYVRGGGCLVLGARSGMKDEYNALHTERQPGPLVAALGARVEQFYALDETVGVSGELGTGEGRIWGEMLHTHSPDARVQMRYSHAGGWLDGQPAMVMRELGAGTIAYLGAWFDEELMQTWATRALERARVEPILAGVPDGVEVAERSGEGRRVLILINHADAVRRIDLPRPLQDVLGGGTRRRVDLPPHEVAVLHDSAAVTQ